MRPTIALAFILSPIRRFLCIQNEKAGADGAPAV